MNNHEDANENKIQPLISNNIVVSKKTSKILNTNNLVNQKKVQETSNTKSQLKSIENKKIDKANSKGNINDTKLVYENIEICGLTHELKNEDNEKWFCKNKNIILSTNKPYLTKVVCLKSGTYTLFLNNENTNNKIIEKIDITFLKTPSINAGKDRELCGDECDLKVKGSKKGFWNTIENVIYNDSKSPKTTVFYTEYGSVNFIWTETYNECKVTDTVTVNFKEKTNADFKIVSKAKNFGDEFVFQATGANIKIYSWDIDNGETKSASNAKLKVSWNNGLKHIITLNVISDNNCKSKYFTEIIQPQKKEIKQSKQIENTISSDVLIPTFFSPNNDGQNDYFNIILKNKASNIATFECAIYSRAGGVLYRMKNINDKWDGKINKINDAKEGTYFYTVKISFLDSLKPIVKKGSIALRR